MTPPSPVSSAPPVSACIDWLLSAITVPNRGHHLALLLHLLCPNRVYPAVRLNRRMLAHGNASRVASHDLLFNGPVATLPTKKSQIEELLRHR